MWKLYKKYKEYILYIIFGGLTTAVNIAAYYIFARVLGVHYMISNAAAWIFSVLFAYVTNKLYVFESRDMGVRFILLEMFKFFGCRGITGLADMGIMYVMVALLSLNDMVVKVVDNVIVIILNYVFSKLIVFKKKDAGR